MHPSMKKGSSVLRTSGSSQARQNESAVYDFFKPEGLEKQIISGAGNTCDIEEKHDR